MVDDGTLSRKRWPNYRRAARVGGQRLPEVGEILVDGERNRQPSRLFFPIAITRIVYRH